ncbi:MAG: hypothetical protein DWQ44_00145 [Bacteroidetes bacterium]|nr:MAG: hypothetical protein DWQ33_05095 [Bacteroidota bacterium]REK06040.1 MAG: hypothetical protein DWQ39_04235 [Bacteroidota bacterium]REK37098.1 MAG: hypothetical protein DWQ44_00145 [Bacteroidota bacterium]REK47509.1 MAG: hypothetical protein DWQ48_12300 [Bacteroidota bacterium]
MKKTGTAISGIIPVLILLCIHINASAVIYLSEDFEVGWTGNPAVPPGWTQSRVVLIGDGIPEQITTNGEKDWEQNTWTGSEWLKSISSGTNPPSAQSGNSVLWMNDIFFGTVTTAYGSRRIESPSMDLSASTSPYLRFYLQYLADATFCNLRIMASADGGISWNSIMIIPANSLTGQAGWERINVLIPTAYRTSSCKIGFEFHNNFGFQNVWIDNLLVEDFTPVTITSAVSGNWNAPATWTGGVVPTSDNHVVVSSGHTVTVNVNMARCQNMTVSGILGYTSTTTQLLHVFGNMNINTGGTYNAFSGTSGRRLYLGGSFSNAGTASFTQGTGVALSGTGNSTLFWIGGEPATFTNSGTITSGRINHIYHANSGGVTYNSPVSVSRFIGLYNGIVNPNGNLTVGNSANSTSHGIERARGSFSTAPIWGSGIVTRNYGYSDGNQFSLTGCFIPSNPMLHAIGEEIETISSVRQITGSMSFNSHSNYRLIFPLLLGTSSTGSLTMNRGILLTDQVNLLTLNTFVSGTPGTDASIVTPPTNHGSYIAGPVRINFPSSGTSTRNFPLGVGTDFNSFTPGSNLKRSISLQTSTAWAGQTITASIEHFPTGIVNPPLSTVMGSRTYRLNLNGGPDLPSTATLTMAARNYAFGNGDNLVGTEEELRIAQGPTDEGPWTERSASSGSSAQLTTNTNYTRTTTTSSQGPIAPLASKGEYFAWGLAPAPPPPCNINNATSCFCADSVSTNCDLLPDIKIARLPLTVQGSTGVIEYSQSGNGANDGRLRISVSTPNIGFGPLEVRSQNIFVCGTDTFPGPPPSLCPDNSPVRQLIKQRVYHKNGSTMTYYDRDAGAMTYHSTHGHMHVDDWGVFTLRKSNGDPNPLNWPTYGNGAKIAFCLMDYGTCSYYSGHCVDDNEVPLNNGNFANFGLGGGSYNCSPTVQGITSGYTDIYYQSLDGMWIDIPPGTCNGEYYIVAHVDPQNFFLESNDNNNVMAVPFTLTKQSGGNPVITASGPTQFCPSGSVTLSSSAAGSYLWSNGATTQSIVVSDTGSYFVTTDAASACPGTSSSIQVSHFNLTATPASTSICVGDSVQLNAIANGSSLQTYTVGSGIITNGSQSYPAPYGNYYWGARHQFLITAAELNTAGITAGYLESIAFDVSSVNSAPIHNNFTVKMGTTVLTTITSFQGGLSTVLNPVNYQPIVGWNTHTFNTPFNWNGSSNIIVEVCFQNGSFVNGGNASVRQSSTAYTSTVYYRADNSTVCGSSTVTSSISQRPNIRFTKNTPLVYSWSPLAGLNNSSISSPKASPATNTVYTVSVTDACNSTAQVNITVNSCGNSSNLSLKSYLQGFYTGGGMMKAVANPINFPLACDTITVELANATSPFTISHSEKTVLGTNGECNVMFTPITPGSMKYIVVRHRNSLETWSASPVQMNSNVDYDFTLSSAAAYGNNLVQVEAGKFALWSGDVSDGLIPGNQDGFITMEDLTELEAQLMLNASGYIVCDLNGDGIVETSDFSILENNVSAGVFLMKP